MLTATAPSLIAALVPVTKSVSVGPPFANAVVICTSRMLQSGHAALIISVSMPVSPSAAGQSPAEVVTLPVSSTAAKHGVPPLGSGRPLPGHAASSGMPYALR